MGKHGIGIAVGFLLIATLGTRVDAGVANVWNFNGDLTTTYGPGGLYYMDEDDASNAAGIPLGDSAYRTGSPPVGHVSTQSLTSFGTANIGGADFGYMTFPKATDNWTGYYVAHTCGRNDPVHNRQSQYTMMYDLRVPQSSFTNDNWMALFQGVHSPTNNTDVGDFFVGLTGVYEGAIGVGTIGPVGYSATGVIQPDAWHRVAWVYDESRTASPNNRTVSLYVDGALVHQSPAEFLQDSRFRPYHTGSSGGSEIINPMQGFFLATSGSPGENSSADLASFMFLNRSMGASEIARMGGVSASGLLDAFPNADVAVSTLAPTHYFRLNEMEANTGSATVLNVGSARTNGTHAGDFTSGNAVVGANGVWLPGFEKGNKAIFHNDKGAVNLGPGSNFAASAMTVSLWFKADDPTYGVGGTFADRLFHNNDATHPFSISAWQTAAGVDRGLVLATGSGSSNDAMLPASVVNLFDGRWHHLVAVRHSGDNVGGLADVSLFVNGVDYTAYLADSADGWGSTGSTAWIGTRSLDSVGNFAGSTDEVAVWLNRKLTTSEAVGLYNAARTPTELPVYAAAVLDKSPVAYYRLNEPSGLNAGETVVNWANQGTTSTNVLGDANAGINDASAAGMVPTFSVTGPRPTDTIGGRNLNGLESDNTAAQFTALSGSGADTTINLGANPALLDSEQLTYSLLFKTSSADAFMRMIVTDPSSPNDFYLVLDEGRLTLVLDADTGSGTAVAWWTGTSALDPRFNDGEWHHVVAVREGDLGANARLYVDGQECALYNRGGGVWGASTSALIGSRGDNLYGFAGLMDEVAIWDRALTGTDVLALYNALTIPEPGSAVLLVLGALAALLFRGRRR